MKTICPIPIEPSVVEYLQTLEDLKKEIFEACSIPYEFLKGMPSKTRTASEIPLLSEAARMRKEREEMNIKPCPFCGGEPEILEKPHSYAVGCTDLQRCPVAPMPFIVCPTKEDAIRAWNTRKEG